mgnify:CR=1 FL=1
MLFSSITFLFLFLPIMLAVYYIAPPQWKNLLLLAGSLIFYAWGEPVYIILMILSILLNYFCGMDIENKSENEAKAKRSLVFAITVNIVLLVFFKYFGFLVESTNTLFGISIPSIGYFFSDCYLLGGFSTETLISRSAIIIPFLIYLILNKYTKDYRIMVPMSYAIGHSVMWCTIWACTYLDDLSFACVGFFIILFIFMAFGIAAPLPYEVIGHGLLFVDIAIANTFLHYPDYVMMFLLGIPLYIGICVFDVAMEKTYRDQVALKLKLEDHLRHDALTGAYNRNVFESLVGENHTFICAKGEYMAIAMYDLDKFKRINDMYGHSAGDEALVAVSEAVRSRLCEDEILVRWGGEEFIVIMKQNERRFEEHAQEIREAVEQLQLETGTVTISVGVAECSKENYQETIKHADTALYRAKNMGRNRVVMYCSEMDSADNGYCG